MDSVAVPRLLNFLSLLSEGHSSYQNKIMYYVTWSLARRARKERKRERKKGGKEGRKEGRNLCIQFKHKLCISSVYAP